MIIYDWEISYLDVYPQESGYTSVVYNVHWRLIGREDQNTEIYSSVYGTILVPPPGEAFIPYQELTKNIVVSWVETAMGTEILDQYKATIAADINQKINPTSETLVPPWE